MVDCLLGHFPFTSAAIVGIFSDLCNPFMSPLPSKLLRGGQIVFLLFFEGFSLRMAMRLSPWAAA